MSSISQAKSGSNLMTFGEIVIPAHHYPTQLISMLESSRQNLKQGREQNSRLTWWLLMSLVTTTNLYTDAPVSSHTCHPL